MYFDSVPAIRYQGPTTSEPLAFRYYDPDRVVRGKRMEDQLRLAVCYWHSFASNGADVFGAGTQARPWHSGDPVAAAGMKAHAAFQFMERLGTRYFTFHDRDVAPELATWKETNAALDGVVGILAREMERTGIKLLWGTANLFSHPRYMAGAATNPDPEVFACAAAQVKKALEVTQALGGENYVLWGGREGYETLLNTDVKQELNQLARFMHLVVEHKQRIGFKGALLIEPKPHEPTKHQYDFDCATVYAFLRHHGLEREFQVNIEANHAQLAGHTFQHEVAYSIAHGIFGSVDINRGDPLLGWDTDQMPNDPLELALVLTEILRAGGFTTGGFNFDAKLRRQSTAPEDLFHAHIAGIDAVARGLLIADRLLEDEVLTRTTQQRYADWFTPRGQQILGDSSLEKLFELVLREELQPRVKSGRQELLENALSRYL
jgi:xylose isomerase